MTLRHAITSEVAVWNLSYSYSINVSAPKGSTTAEIMLGAYCSFGPGSSFSPGHGFTSIVYRYDPGGFMNQSKSGISTLVSNVLRGPAGTVVSVRNWLELDVWLYSDAPTLSTVSVNFDMATGGNQAQLLSWSTG
ncbi:MAG: hypothetical protein ACHQ2Y_01505 [Candidatus Lutacidiplasmatales archaeon]